MKVRLALAGTAAVLVSAVLVGFMTRTPRPESPAMPRIEPPATDAELVGAALVSPAEATATDPARRSRVTPERSGGAATARGANVLRVVLEGITEEDARQTTVTLTGVDDRRDEWPTHLRNSWTCRGSTSEFELDPFFASVAAATRGDLHLDGLEVKVCPPRHRIERTRVPLSSGVEQKGGPTVYEVRVRLVPGVPHVYWPELTLAVRDARTRAHLDDVELHCVPTALMGLPRMPGTDGVFTSLGGGLSSPIVLLAGREADGPEGWVAGLAISPAAGEAPRLRELERPERTERGVVVYARAPGYAWNSIAIDVSKGERELLLEPGATLSVRLANVQLEGYAALATVPRLCIYWIRADGGDQNVRLERLDATLATEGLWLDGLAPGGYRVAVELDGGSWTERPVLARDEVSLAAGETREVVLALADPPAPPERATLGGVVSFPAFGGEEEVRLQLYFQPTQRVRHPDVELSLADLQRVGGALPTWSFRVEGLPVGMYRVQLLPFLKVRMIELPAGGREDVELVLPELAEVLVETVDGQTGERVPLDEFYYKNRDALPGQVQNDWARADSVEPGRFRFWAAPGAVTVWPRLQGRLGYGLRWEDHELVSGPQSLRFELAPVYAMRFEFREGGTALPTGPQGLDVSRDIRAVDHEGRVTGDGLQTDMRVEVSAPGLYEIRFEGVTGDRYHPIPPRRVDVRAGETTDVIVELRRN